MVHNGVEYGMMASIAEGLSIIKHANAGLLVRERTPNGSVGKPRVLLLRNQRCRRRRGLASRLGREFLVGRPHCGRPCAVAELAEFSGRVSDSGEGRWTVKRRSTSRCPRR